MAKHPLKKPTAPPEPPAPLPTSQEPVAAADPLVDTAVAMADAAAATATENREFQRSVHLLIAKLERASTIGHGADSDRELMKEAAALIRMVAGLKPTDELSHVPKPVYAPVRNDPPAGHSLPYELPTTGQSDH